MSDQTKETKMEECIICGQGHDDQEEVRLTDGTFYHDECYWQGEPSEAFSEAEDEPS